MDIRSHIDRLYEDESLTDNLTDEQAGPLLAWGAAGIGKASTEEEALETIAAIRRINREVGEGKAFEDLFPDDPIAPSGIPPGAPENPPPDRP